MQAEREEIFKIHLNKRDRDPKDFDVSLLADQTTDYVGAEIEAVIEDAMFSAFDENKEIATKHVLTAIKETVPQATRDVEELKAIREWVRTRARVVSGKDPNKKSRKGKVRTLRADKRRE
jgi:SpoVK/Ycf46/Vps4 family AAA+-type ATPase